MSIPAKKKGPRFSKTQELVTFKIGKDDKIETFVVHKEFACHYSPVLKAAFNSDFIEGQTQTYILEDIGEHGIESFTLFVEWLYTQKLDLLEELKDIVDGDKEYRNIPVNTQRTVAAQTKAAEVWILAEKLLVPSLQNLAIEQFERISFDIKRIPGDGHTKYIFANTSQGNRAAPIHHNITNFKTIPPTAAQRRSSADSIHTLNMIPPRRQRAQVVLPGTTPRRTITPRAPSTPVAASAPVMAPVSPSATPAMIVKLKLNMKAKQKGNGPNFSSGSGQQVVTILAGSGEKEEKFIVHKAFACHYCPVFKAAFESGFIEGQTQTYKLDDVEPKVVQLLVQWLYTQRLDIRVDMEVDNKLFSHLEEPFHLQSQFGLLQTSFYSQVSKMR
ncbi:hypothetical protein LAWI1_G001527 [Lachnellula willkommii]|uniref:BTB domain-containing protein n=1 Tax=Lachnellula willkommii TaxID=215461 RepID=A0A559MHV3_9HELO|nr:hypothetical protein LAWI1_G001527 [Lachnellula willkommii]